MLSNYRGFFGRRGSEYPEESSRARHSLRPQYARNVWLGPPSNSAIATLFRRTNHDDRTRRLRTGGARHKSWGSYAFHLQAVGRKRIALCNSTSIRTRRPRTRGAKTSWLRKENNPRNARAGNTLSWDFDHPP